MKLKKLRRQGHDVVRRWRDRNKPPLHFLHIGKTGGTAIKTTLRQVPSECYRLALHPHRIHLPDVPAGELVTFVVRDPVGRFVSGFNSRLRQGGVHHRDWSAAERAAFQQFPTPEALALGLGSENEDEAAAARVAMQSVNHLRVHQSAWVGDLDLLRARSSDVLMVGRQWALAEDFARLAELIGLPTRLLPEDPTISNRTPTGFSTQLSDRAVAIVRREYADDYALLEELARLGPSVGFLGDLPQQMRA